MLVGPYPYSTSRTYLGTIAQEHRMNVTSNNLANVGTPGFKKDVATFDPQSEGYVVKGTQDLSQPRSPGEDGKQARCGLERSGVFFRSIRPTAFATPATDHLPATLTGEIVTMDGHPVVGGGIVPENVVDLVITEDGAILADGEQIGQFELVEFDDPNILSKEGNNLFTTKIDGVAGNAAA